MTRGWAVARGATRRSIGREFVQRTKAPGGTPHPHPFIRNLIRIIIRIHHDPQPVWSGRPLRRSPRRIPPAPMAEAAMVANNIGNMYKSDNTRATTHGNIMSRVVDLEHKSDIMNIDITHLESMIGDLEHRTDTASHSTTMFKVDAAERIIILEERLTDLERKLRLQSELDLERLMTAP